LVVIISFFFQCNFFSLLNLHSTRKVNPFSSELHNISLAILAK